MKYFVHLLCILPMLFTACDTKMTLRQAFDEVSKIERFETEEYTENLFGFPTCFGDGIMCIHPNSSYKKKVINLLNQLPKEWLACEIKDGERQFDRFYVTQDDSNRELLFVHVGHRTGDTVLILFSNIDKTDVMHFLSKLKKRIDNPDNS